MYTPHNSSVKFSFFDPLTIKKASFIIFVGQSEKHIKLLTDTLLKCLIYR